MARWTTSKQIPTFERNIFPVVFRDDIWIFSERCGGISWFILTKDTENVKRHGSRIFDGDLRHVTTHGDAIYIFCYRDRGDVWLLYKLDTATMEVKPIMRSMVIGCPVGSSDMPIIGNKMCALTTFGYRIQLTKIDLITLSHETADLMRYDRSKQYSIVSNADDLYLFGFCSQNRTVSILEEGGRMREVSTFAFDGLHHLWGKLYNKYMFVKPMSNMKDVASMDSFDFSTNQWKQKIVEQYPWDSDFNRIKSVLVADNTIYTIIDCSPYEPRGSFDYECRVLELEPKLSEICLLNTVEDFLPRKMAKAESVRESIPIPLREKYDNIVEWKRRMGDWRMKNEETRTKLAMDPHGPRYHL